MHWDVVPRKEFPKSGAVGPDAYGDRGALEEAERGPWVVRGLVWTEEDADAGATKVVDPAKVGELTVLKHIVTPRKEGHVGGHASGLGGGLLIQHVQHLLGQPTAVLPGVSGPP